MMMTKEQLEQAAAELCRLRGVSGEGHLFAAIQEIKHYALIHQAMEHAKHGRQS